MDLLLYPTNAELLGWEWQKGIFQSASLTAIYMTPLVLLLLSTILFCVNKRHRKNSGNGNGNDNNDDDDNDNDIAGVISNSVVTQISKSKKRSAVVVSGDHNRSSSIAAASQKSSSLSWFYRVFIKEGLRIETSRLNVKEILENEIDIMTTQTQMMRNNNTNNNSDSYQFHRTGKLYKIHPRTAITEDDIRKVYPDFNCTIDDNNDNSNRHYGNNADTQYYGGDSVVLFFRLASIFVLCGMSTIENQQILIKVAKALKLPPISLLNLGLTEITVQFNLGAVVNISCSTAAFYQLSLLSRTQQLAHCIIQNKNRNATATKTKTTSSMNSKTNDNDNDNDKDHQQQQQTATTMVLIPASVYLRVLDEMEQDHAADPYGWLIRIIAIYIVCVFAPLAVYNGYYINLVWSSIISLFIVIALLILQSGWLPSSISSRWECPIVSFITGLISSILWQITAHADDNKYLIEPLGQCVANYSIGVLLIWFPGSTLVYGAHEVCLGSYTNGGIRLIKGIISAMVIALFYTVGWQYWGVNWASNETMFGEPTNLYNTTGSISSLPPSVNCAANDNLALPWYINQVAFAIPLNAATMIVFNIRLRDCPGVFLVAQATYCIQGALGYCGENSLYCGIPTYVTTLIIAFAGGCFSEINAFLTGFSKYGSMLAIIFVLAPGAGCVKAILGAFHRTEGDEKANESTIWESVVFEGVAYAVGFYLAFDVLGPTVTFLTDVFCTTTIPSTTTTTGASSRSNKGTQNHDDNSKQKAQDYSYDGGAGDQGAVPTATRGPSRQDNFMEENADC